MSDSCDPMDCSPPGSSVHEISQARILEWVAIPSPLLYSQSWVSSESCSACYFLVIFFSPASGSFILCLCRSVLNLNSKTLSSDLSSSLSLSEQLSSLWYLSYKFWSLAFLNSGSYVLTRQDHQAVWNPCPYIV